MGNFLPIWLPSSSDEDNEDNEDDMNDITIDQLYNMMIGYLNDYPYEDLVIGLHNENYNNMNFWSLMQKYEDELTLRIVKYGRTVDRQTRTIRGILITNSYTVWGLEQGQAIET